MLRQGRRSLPISIPVAGSVILPGSWMIGYFPVQTAGKSWPAGGPLAGESVLWGHYEGHLCLHLCCSRRKRSPNPCFPLHVHETKGAVLVANPLEHCSF